MWIIEELFGFLARNRSGVSKAQLFEDFLDAAEGGYVNGLTSYVDTLSSRFKSLDPAGELGLNAKEYDTDLNYTGAISFGSNWCYFMQIKDVVKKNEYVEDKSWMNE